MENTITINAPKKRDLFTIDPRAVTADSTKNLRFDYGNDEEWQQLKESIRENGVHVPIKVKTNGATESGVPLYNLVHGFRRLRAVMELISEGHDIVRIPAITVPIAYSENDALFDHFIDNSGKELNILERAEGFKRAMDAGYTIAEIEKKIGTGKLSHGNVVQIAQLANTPDSFKKLIADGRISATLVIDLLRVADWDTKKVEAKLNDLLSTKSGKITRKDFANDPNAAPRPFPQQKVWRLAVDKMTEAGVEEEKVNKVKALVEKLEPLMYITNSKKDEEVQKAVDALLNFI